MIECATCEHWPWCSMIPEECMAEPITLDKLAEYAHLPFYEYEEIEVVNRKNSGWKKEVD